MRTIRIVATCLVLTLAFVVPAQARRGVRVPLSVRITAFVNEKLEGINPDFDWKVSYKGKEYMLYVLNLVSLDGRTTALGIDSAVRQYPIQFRLAGNDKALQTLIATPPRQQVVISAYLNFAGGTQIMMVNSVESAPPPTAAP